ncbi:MAG: Holliday junction resolvase RuvX [Eubacteriales bacterium]|nr:Holliday junction resolvase RuvX [Eubacteriales bacterium]
MVIMAVDLGKARTGIAASDKTEYLAYPVEVISERRREALLEKVADKARELKAELVVVGLPKNMDGSEGESALSAREFAGKLKDELDLEVKLWDERCTTITAHGYMNDTNTRGKKRKAIIDEVAAVVILQSFLDSRR